MTRYDDGWDTIAQTLREEVQEMHKAREAGLAQCRQLIQLASKCIRHVHRRQFEAAEVLLQEARSVTESTQAVLAAHPHVYHAGYLQDAEKEYVEAAAVMAIVQQHRYPTPTELGVGPISYLNGMGEAASECRRFALDRMRAGDLEEAERIVERMEAVYEELITFDYPDGMTGGLRRTCDALRAVIERTRSDLTTTQSHHELVNELRETRAALGRE